VSHAINIQIVEDELIQRKSVAAVVLVPEAILYPYGIELFVSLILTEQNVLLDLLYGPLDSVLLIAPVADLVTYYFLKMTSKAGDGVALASDL